MIGIYYVLLLVAQANSKFKGFKFSEAKSAGLCSDSKHVALH